MFWINGKLTTVNEWALTEGIAPIACEYGTNLEMNNGLVGKHLDFYYTFMKNTTSTVISYHCVGIENNQFMMGTSDILSVNPEDYNDVRKHTQGDARKVFGQAFFVGLKIADHIPIHSIYFSGSNTKLETIYGLMIKNKIFLDRVRQLNWQYDHELEKKYFFSRIK